MGKPDRQHAGHAQPAGLGAAAAASMGRVGRSYCTSYEWMANRESYSTQLSRIVSAVTLDRYIASSLAVRGLGGRTPPLQLHAPYC
jgi:hypothetical protein